jgi:cyclopropane fatty-acyl-phospholipid synthase-like methyltransferase
LNKLLNRLRNQFLTKIADKYVILNAKFNSLKFGSKEMIPRDLPSHTINENRRLWDNYNWSQSGEEWTYHAKLYKGLDPEAWKHSLIKEVMLKYIRRGSTILEIGPGAGRWTETLVTLADTLILADISKKCLDLCKERFKNYNNIQYRLTGGQLDFIQENSIDYIWSYDVFVHINPTDIRTYLRDIQRILKPQGYGIIHHSGQYDNNKTREKGFRSYMAPELFASWVADNGMEMVEQNSKLVHIPGDVLSVFSKPR